jgi:2,4-diaminopentanoate dehydrogenase
MEVEEVRGSFDREPTDRDTQVAFGTIKAGTCGAVRTRTAGVVHGREAIVIEHVIRMARDVAPDWPTSGSDATYRVDIEGDPDIHCAMTLGEAEGHGAGRAAMAATAIRVSTRSRTSSMPRQGCSAHWTCRLPCRAMYLTKR